MAKRGINLSGSCLSGCSGGGSTPGPTGPTGPPSTVAGPTGPASTIPGHTGPASRVTGPTGPASTIPGPTGPASTIPGPTGPASTVTGPTGPASTVTGPTGPPGPPGTCECCEWYKFVFYNEVGNLKTNAPLSIIPSFDINPSTRPGAGYRNGKIAPYHISGPWNYIAGGSITITACSVLTPEITYPCYAWGAVYRNNATERQFLGIIEFTISEPKNTEINTSGTIDKTLLSSDGSDGLYQSTVFLVPDKSRLEEGTINVIQDWFIGMELVYPNDEGGSVSFKISDSSGDTTYSWPRPYSSAIGGYAFTHLSLELCRATR